MRELHQRDLHTELGEQIDATEDLVPLLEIRLKMATMREANARELAKHAEKNYQEATTSLEGATSKRTYWEAQLQKTQERNQPARATGSKGERRVFHNDEGTIIESGTIAEPEKPRSKLHHSAEFILSIKGANPPHNFTSHYVSLQRAGKEAAFQMGLSPEDFELEPLGEWVWDRISGGLKGRAWYNLPSHTTHSSFCDAVWIRHTQNLNASKES